MSPVIMNSADSQGSKFTSAYEFSEILNSPGAGLWVLVPRDVAGVTIQLIIQDGEGYIEATTDSVNAVNTGSVVGIRWPNGSVTSTTENRVFGITAFRAVHKAGVIKLCARAQ